MNDNELINQKKIAFTIDLTSGIQIYADPGLLNLVIRNLISRFNFSIPPAPSKIDRTGNPVGYFLHK